MLELVNALYHTWEACLRTPLTHHSIFWGGVASQGEAHSKGEWPSWVFWDSLDESHCQQGGEVVWLIFFCFGSALGVSGVRFEKFLLVTGGAECALIWLSVAYCEGMHFGLSGFVILSFCLLLYRFCWVFASFRRNRCFASAWLCWALPLSLRGHA